MRLPCRRAVWVRRRRFSGAPGNAGSSAPARVGGSIRAGSRGSRTGNKTMLGRDLHGGAHEEPENGWTKDRLAFNCFLAMAADVRSSFAAARTEAISSMPLSNASNRHVTMPSGVPL
jgi:hypothetical protein